MASAPTTKGTARSSRRATTANVNVRAAIHAKATTTIKAIAFVLLKPECAAWGCVVANTLWPIERSISGANSYQRTRAATACDRSDIDHRSRGPRVVLQTRA